MSLCILSNSQDVYDVDDAVEGVQNPNSFHNALGNTITLPPMSEVGVVSTKIYRKPLVVIQNNSVFYSYFGTMLNAAQVAENSLVTMPIPVIISRGTYSHAQLTTELQKQLSDSFGCHPNLAYLGCKVTAPIVGGSPGVTAGGWGFQVEQTSKGTLVPGTAGLVVGNIAVAAQQLSLQSLGESIRGADVADPATSMLYTALTKRISRIRPGVESGDALDDLGVAMIKDLPITMTGELAATTALLGGAFQVDLRQALDATVAAGQGFRVGLSRPETRVGQNPPAVSNPDYFDGAAFYDYVVEFDQDADLIRLRHTVIDPVDEVMRLFEVEYYGDGTNGTADITALEPTAFAAQATSAALTDGQILNWSFYGEQCKVWLSKADYTRPKVLMDTTIDGWAQLGLDHAFKPAGSACSALYPKFDLSTSGAGVYFTLVNYECPLPFAQRSGQDDGYNFPFEVPPYPAPYHRPGPDASSLWGKAIYSDVYRRAAELSDQSDRYLNDGLAKIAYQGMDGSASGAPGKAKVNNEAIKYGYGFIFNSDVGDPGVYPALDGTGNCRSWMGFPADDVPGNVLSHDGVHPLGIVSDSGEGTPVNSVSRCLWKVNSYENVDFAPKQLFLKCSSLTHQSYNFCKGLPSKILWSLPRFSNSGATTGPLYFQQAQPIYLALRNSAPLVINDLRIEFVDKDERVVSDLGGESVVVLHFKDGHHKCG